MDSNPYASYECTDEIDPNRLTALQACALIAVSILLFVELPVWLPSVVAGLCACKLFGDSEGAFIVGFCLAAGASTPIAGYYVYSPVINWLRECILTLSS